MFETLFCYPRVLARHRTGPSAEERDRFLAHHAQVGATPKSLLRLASELLLVARRIDVSGPTAITPLEIEAAADGWVRHQRRHRRVRDPKFCRQRFVQVATDWLHFLDRLQATQEHDRLPRLTVVKQSLAGAVAPALNDCATHSPAKAVARSAGPVDGRSGPTRRNLRPSPGRARRASRGIRRSAHRSSPPGHRRAGWN